MSQQDWQHPHHHEPLSADPDDASRQMPKNIPARMRIHTKVIFRHKFASEKEAINLPNWKNYWLTNSDNQIIFLPFQTMPKLLNKAPLIRPTRPKLREDSPTPTISQDKTEHTK